MSDWGGPYDDELENEVLMRSLHSTPRAVAEDVGISVEDVRAINERLEEVDE